MNKISKKIVALVTMAAFVLTLAPVAAFAADSDPVADKSTYKVETTGNAGELKVTVNLNKAAGGAASTDCNTPSVQVFVTGTEDDTAVETNSTTSACTTAGAAAEGVTATNSSTATLTFTYSGLAAGKHDVTVKMDQDGTGADDYGYVAIKVEDGQQSSAYVSEAPSVGASKLLTSSDDNDLNNKSEVTVDPGDELNIKFNVRDASGDASELQLAAANGARVWVVNEDGQFSDAITLTSGDLTLGDITATNPKKYVKKVETAITAGKYFKATFNRPGTYYIYAGIGTSVVDSTDPANALANIDKLGGCVKVTINPKNYVTKTFELAGNVADGTMTSTKANEFTYDITDTVTPNGIKVYTVTGTAYQADGTAAQYEKLNLTSNKSGLKLLDSEVGTDANGAFSFRFTMSKSDTYKVTIAESNGDAKAVLTVDKSSVEAADITTAKDGGTLLAANDSNYNANATDADYFASDVQFKLYDKYGNELTGPAALNGQNANSTTATTVADYISVEGPKDSKLEAGDLQLIWNADKGVYTLQYTDRDATGVANDLVPGDYTVKVSLNNGEVATATFSLAKFGTVKDIAFEMTAAASQNVNDPDNDAITQINDQVALGQTVSVTAKYVDENGVKVNADASNLVWGVNGDAVTGRNLGTNPITFTTADNTAANSSLVGTTVTVKVFDNDKNIYQEKDLTVVKNYQAETLAFDATEGPADKNNTVNVSVVDENGNVSKVNGNMHAYVASQSNEEANVDVTANANVSNGKGKLTIYSDKETSLDIVVVVSADNGEMYGKTLTYTVGGKDINADTSVVMTIGSSDFVVNNQLVTSDAAPYVAQDRTFVPFRALGEALGAKVEWDNDARTVTYVLGDNTVVMTIGDTTYTVNGEEKTMDVAPEITGERTYVPVRFVGEALGFSVTALYDTNGTTASVVFQK